VKGALTYLTVTKLKNQLKAILKSPAHLIYGIILIGLLVVMAFSGNEMQQDISELRSRQELIFIIMGFFTIMFVMVFMQAYQNGSSMFTLSDVNLLFPSPIRSTKVLFYGLFRQLGTSIVLGVFLLFQYSWLNGLYGIHYVELVLIILGYAMTIFMAQFTAMTLFVYTSNDEKAQKIVRFSVYGLVLVLLLSAIASILPSFDGKDFMQLLPKATEFFTNPIVLAFPVSGWIAGIFLGIVTDNYLFVVLYALLLILFAVLLAVLIIRSKRNFYEDVIQAAETSQSAINAKKEGQVGEVVGKNVKVGKVGLGKGRGSSAIFYKHMLENRRSGLFLISNMSLIFVVCSVAASFFMKDAGIIAIFSMATYMQIFSVMLGRFTRELSKPFIYLIPEPPLKKLLYSIAESMVTSLFEALIIFIPVGLIVGADAPDIICCVIARMSFALLFTAANIVLERVFGGVRSKALVMFFFFLVTILIAIPGIVGAALVGVSGITLLSEYTLILLTMSAANLLISLLVLYLCRNLLQYAELNNK